MTLTLPNLLTLLRVALIPVFVAVFYAPWQYASLAATVIFVVAAVTDWFDGWLARRWNQTSRFGAFLDPVADKLMVATAMVLVVQQDPQWWLAVAVTIIIGREITISALREWMAELGERTAVKVSFIGKFKTAFQMISIILLVLREPIFGLPIYLLGLILLAVSVVLTLWSMWAYLRAAWPLLKDEVTSPTH